MARGGTARKLDDWIEMLAEMDDFADWTSEEIAEMLGELVGAGELREYTDATGESTIVASSADEVFALYLDYFDPEGQ